MDRQSARYISTLQPYLRPYAEYLVVAFNDAGWPLIVTSGRRSSSRQAELIRAGYTTATRSRHLTGDAFDVGLRGYKWRDVPEWVWDIVGEYGESLGLRWGGRFTTPDPIHFDTG